MRITVKKWGNSASVRIPVAVMQAAHLALDQSVDVREENGRVVIEAVQPPPYDLRAMIAGITDDNRHEAIDTGPRVGNEFW